MRYLNFSNVGENMLSLIYKKQIWDGEDLKKLTELMGNKLKNHNAKLKSLSYPIAGLDKLALELTKKVDAEVLSDIFTQEKAPKKLNFYVPTGFKVNKKDCDLNQMNFVFGNFYLALYLPEQGILEFRGDTLGVEILDKPQSYQNILVKILDKYEIDIDQVSHLIFSEVFDKVVETEEVVIEEEVPGGQSLMSVYGFRAESYRISAEQKSKLKKITK